nr:uncharacterized protein LOC123746218 [Procambarus clarkii]
MVWVLQVVAVVSSEVGQEQRLRQHHHREMFQRSTLANFIKRRRREKETIRRFETVEKEVRTSNPARAEDLIRLRDEHLTYHTTWCRIKYHPRLLKVNKSEEELQEVDETNEEIEQLLQVWELLLVQYLPQVNPSPRDLFELQISSIYSTTFSLVTTKLFNLSSFHLYRFIQLEA